MGMLGGGEEDTKVPLLGSLYPDCPGCKCAHLTAQGAGPPIKVLLMVMIIVICNTLPVASLYPFIYFMVDDFGIAGKKEDIGYYAGALGSVLMLGRFFSSLAWGIFADKYGRRVVFVLGLLSVIVFQMIFGSTNNFWVAFAARFLYGAFNGMLGPLKAYSSEICNEENQAWGVSTVTTSWNLGLIIGPAMGGYLARPAVNFPRIFSPNGFFGRYPYILPSIIQAVFALFGMVIVFFMPETVHKHKKNYFSDDQTMLVDAAKVKKSLWRNPALMASVAVYCLWCFMELAFTEIFSLWSVSPREADGLGLSTSDVGLVLAVSGATVMVFNMTLFPLIASYLGPILVTRIPASICVPVMLFFPFISRLQGKVQWLVLNFLSLTRYILTTAVGTGTAMLINNSVPTNQRGAANGVSVTCNALVRTAGPASAGALFSWSQSRLDAMFLPGIQSFFAVLVAGIILAIITTFPPVLPKSTNRPYYITHPEEEIDCRDEEAW